MAEGMSRKIVPLTLLKDAFGEAVELDGGKRMEAYRILAEFEADGKPYAILQSDAMKSRDELDVFRIRTGPDGSLELETLDDDDEWEDIAELYDEMTFRFED